MKSHYRNPDYKPQGNSLAKLSRHLDTPEWADTPRNSDGVPQTWQGAA